MDICCGIIIDIAFVLRSNRMTFRSLRAGRCGLSESRI